MDDRCPGISAAHDARQPGAVAIVCFSRKGIERAVQFSLNRTIRHLMCTARISSFPPNHQITTMSLLLLAYRSIYFASRNYLDEARWPLFYRSSVRVHVCVCVSRKRMKKADQKFMQPSITVCYDEFQT